MQHLRYAVAMATALLALAIPASAMAAPAPGFEVFADCPSKADDPLIEGCVVTTVTDGHIKLGSKNTPITDPIKLVAAATRDGRAVVGSFDGGHQRVPGGLIGITGLDWLDWLFPFSLLTLHAEAELAGTPSSPAAEPLTLPLKVRLVSPLLNSTCYIGSNTNPITLVLRTGTTNPPPPNQPITGTPAHSSPDPNNPFIARLTGGVLVDNEFAVPGAQGCDLFGFGLINALVNHQAGLPSPAGNNETVQEFEAALTNIRLIYPPAGIEAP